MEYNAKLHAKAKRMLMQMDYFARFFHGDGSLGLPAYAPYDAILVTAGAPAVPQALVQQLGNNGKLIIPVGDKKRQRMLRINKHADGRITQEQFNHFAFVPLKGKQGWHT